MGIKLGNVNVSKIMLGNVEADKIYFGTTEVYSSGPDYLCFEAIENTTIKFVINGTLSTIPVIQYKVDDGTWSNYTFGNSISLNIGQKCYWKGNNNSFSKDYYNCIKFTSTGKVAASGNIMSLLDSTLESVTIPNDYCFAQMFSSCTNLTSAPSLPATTLKEQCYQEMFQGCTSLTTAPSLPATTLASYCYYRMFKNCTSLTSAPALPATSLIAFCYENMFSGCTSLYVSDTQTTEASHEWHIPASGTFTNTSTQNQSNMFTNCKGSRSSDNMSGAFGESHTYYTQNAPIQ